MIQLEPEMTYVASGQVIKNKKTSQVSTELLDQVLSWTPLVDTSRDIAMRVRLVSPSASWEEIDEILRQVSRGVKPLIESHADQGFSTRLFFVVRREVFKVAVRHPGRQDIPGITRLIYWCLLEILHKYSPDYLSALCNGLSGVDLQ